MTDVLAARLADIVGADHVLADPPAMQPYVADWRGAYRGRARAVVRPASTEQVVEVVKTCTADGVAIVPQGGNTGMCGGATPSAKGDQVVLSMGRMNRILEVDAVNNTLAAEAGCVLASLQEAAAEAGRLFPLSLAAEGSCQIGGNLATNAGGINVLRFGNARDLVLGLEVVLADGTLWDGMRALRKDNRGYDLKQLFVGSEGTLGVITRAILKLFLPPGESVSAIIALDDATHAVQLLNVLRARCGDTIQAFELIGSICLSLVCRHIPGTRMPLAGHHRWYVLTEIAGTEGGKSPRPAVESVLADAIERGWAADAALAESVAQANAFWRLRETIPEATRAEGAAFRSDISIRVGSVAAFIADASAAFEARFPAARIVCFGHVGDGNLHFNALLPIDTDATLLTPVMATMLYDLVARYDGSFSAEHGVGQAKRDELLRYKSHVEIDYMRRIKQVFDPRCLMNPGKIL